MEEWQTEAVRLFGEGVSYRAIAEQVGQSRKRVTYHLKKLGYHHQVNPNILTANRRTGENKRRPLYTCQHCGKEYWAKAHDRDKYCGRPCSFAAKAIRASVERPIREAERIAARRKACVICGEGFNPKRTDETYCSRECRLEVGRRKAREAGLSQWEPRAVVCKECGASFQTAYKQGHYRLTFCSPQCGKRLHRREARRKNGNQDTPRRRARQLGVEYVPVKATTIFVRDGWRCRLCGRKTPSTLRGTIAPNAPELDHIIPWACGGSHTPNNLQCLCRACNLKKGAVGGGQMVLV